MGVKILAGLIAGLGIGLMARADSTDESSPRRLAASPDGRLVAVAADDGRVRVWEADTGRLRHDLDLGRPGTAVAFAPDGRTLIAGTEGVRRSADEPGQAELRAWDLTADPPTPRWRAPVVGRVMALAVDPLGDWCAASTVYSTVGVYGLADGAPRRNWTEPGNPDLDAAVAADGATLLTAGQRLIAWDPTAGRAAEGPAPAPAPDAEASARASRWRGPVASAVAVARAGGWAVVAGAFANEQGRTIDLARVEVRSGAVERVIGRDLDGVACLALAPDDATLVVGLGAGRLRRIDLAGGREPLEWPLDGVGAVRSVAFLAGGRILAVAGRDGTPVLLVDAADGRTLRRLWPAP